MTSALTDSGNGKVVVRRGSIVVDSGNAGAIVVTGNGSVQAAQIDVAGGDRTRSNGKISGAVQTRHASLTGLLSSIPCARRSDTPVDVTDARNVIRGNSSLVRWFADDDRDRNGPSFGRRAKGVPCVAALGGTWPHTEKGLFSQASG